MDGAGRFTMVPTKKSFIVHSVGAAEESPGHWCGIILQIPDNFKNLPVKNQTVYFTAVEAHGTPPKFEEIYHTSVELTFDEYLEILAFFTFEWQHIKEVGDQQINKMRRGTAPVFIENGLSFFGSGILKFKRKFGNAVLRFKKSSEDEIFEMFLQKEGRYSVVHPDVVTQLAANHACLLNLFTDYKLKCQEIY